MLATEVYQSQTRSPIELRRFIDRRWFFQREGTISYPEYIIASLIDIDGVSCGTLSGMLQYVAASNPPQYRETSIGHDFVYAKCEQVTVGGQVTWELVVYCQKDPCGGIFHFRRTAAQDDPAGDYCLLSNGQPDCNLGQAIITVA